MIATLAGLPEYVLLLLIAGCLLLAGAAVFIVGRVIFGRDAEPARRLIQLVRAVREGGNEESDHGAVKHPQDQLETPHVSPDHDENQPGRTRTS